ncbi:MAG TPA: enoyl-CoA hydratase-related protein [Actinomycetota bacterium]|jgi:enoyl-CoA hydratase/carnithine racemase|nr:enoyl-CoA hydratase-related protein [Actinomycetota bacterium]
MATKTYETVLIDIADGIATLTLNRPEALNAFNTALDTEFHEAMWELERNESVRVIVVTGAGKAFSSGLDLSDGGAALSGAEATHEGEMGLTADTIPDRSAFWKMRTPVIAAVNGAAIGAALNVALLMDIVIVAEDAKLRLPFARIGVVPDANATWLLPRLIGTQKALELFLTGRFFTGAEAAELGLALKAVPKDDVLRTALELAREIATYAAPAAAGLTKQLVYKFMLETDRQKAFALETKIIFWLGQQPDAMAGVMALLQKSEPSFTGSKHTELPEDLG